MSRTMLTMRIVVGSVAVIIATGCAPVLPLEEATEWQFEGFPVYSYIPEEPVGIVYMFHGSNGSANFATKVESTEQLNALVERGCGWVATESTERTGDKRWLVDDASLVTNPDLARLQRLHGRLIGDTGVTATTPIFGIGMSNGARMVTLFGQTFANAGYPIAAVAPFMGEAAPSVNSAGGLEVPAFWVIAENDTVVDNFKIAVDHLQNQATGAASVLYTKHEEPVLSLRFTRIPAIDAAEAEVIRATLAATGVWDSSGSRVGTVAEAQQALAALRVPPSFGAAAADVRNQVQAILAVHTFVGLPRILVADFFDAQLP